MKRGLKRVLSIALLVVTMLQLTACTGFFTNPVSLMQPPKSSGDLVEIEEALSAVSANYELSYPSTGDYRNAIIIRDLNYDGKNEAIAFYQTSDNQTITVHINILAYDKGEWDSKYDSILNASGIDRVEFHDVCADKTQEIFVGCKLYNAQEQQLNVYKYENKNITLLTEETYTNYCVGNLGASTKPQVVLFTIANQVQDSATVQKSSQIKKQVSAKLLSLSYEDTVPVTLGTVAFDSNIVSFASMSVSPIAEDKSGVFVDAIVDSNAMITEVFYYNDTLKTLFYNKRANSTDKTYRDSLIGCKDIDNDGVIEIPKTYVCQGYETNVSADEKVYFTEWYGVKGKQLGERETCGFINNADNYFLNTPATWLGIITVQRNFDNRERVFYEWDFEKRTYGEELFKIKVFLKSNFKKNNSNYKKIAEDDEYVYAAKINTKAVSQNQVDIKYLKENIVLL